MKAIFQSVGKIAPETAAKLFSQLRSRDLNSHERDTYVGNKIYTSPVHVDKRRRRSSVRSYLRDTINAKYSNGSRKYPITIALYSLVSRIIMTSSMSSNPAGQAGQRPKAIGVEFIYGEGIYRADKRHNGTQKGTPMTVAVTREVIVSGGAFNSP